MDRSQYVLPQDQPIVFLDAKAAFEGLSRSEKLYAHHLSKASWLGGLVTFLQTSVESAKLFVIFHKLFSSQNPPAFKTAALEAGFAEQEVQALLVYVSGVLCNAGNYKGFGDTKFVPGIEVGRLEGLLRLSPVWTELEKLWAEVREAVYDLEAGRHCLGYKPHGCTAYFSGNMDESDNRRVQEWSKQKKIELYNSRCFKTVENGLTVYEIRLAGAQKGLLTEERVGDALFKMVKGDYMYLMDKVSVAKV